MLDVAGAEARRVARTFVWVTTEADPDVVVGCYSRTDALGRVVVATQTVTARFVVVDALHEWAATFYERYGFRRIPGTLRLCSRRDR